MGIRNVRNIFSINIDHMLIFLDDNGDGNPDDPKEFTKYFTAEEKTAQAAPQGILQSSPAEATASWDPQNRLPRHKCPLQSTMPVAA